MNYEEKYNKILEWARKNKARLNGVPIEEVLPELAESEDERALRIIRKRMCYDPVPISDEDRRIVENWLEKQKDSVSNNFDDVWDEEDCEEIIAEGQKLTPRFKELLKEVCHAWYDRGATLEKQKENPKSSDSIPLDCTSDAKCEDRWHKVTDSLPDNGRLVLAKDCLGNVLLARYDGENWEVNVYDNEDHYCHNSISKWCEIPSEKQKGQKPISFYGHYNPDDYEVVREGNATSLKKKEQKSVEWSEEDIKKIRSEEYTKGFNDAAFGGKLKEWSEEDEEISKRIISDLRWGRRNTVSDKDIRQYDEEINWMENRLKSLRPSWKPSEEQMKALQNAVALTACDKELVRLYNQLKKL